MSIEGTWYNKLGSQMTLKIADGGITGDYESKVGDVPGHYTLVGRYDINPDTGHGTALGWSVSWKNDKYNVHSATSWTGQFFSGSERIDTTWLLARHTTPADLWESTHIGQDEFTKTPPTDAAVQELLQRGARASHPLR